MANKTVENIPLIQENKEQKNEALIERKVNDAGVGPNDDEKKNSNENRKSQVINCNVDDLDAQFDIKELIPDRECSKQCIHLRYCITRPTAASMKCEGCLGVPVDPYTCQKGHPCCRSCSHTNPNNNKAVCPKADCKNRIVNKDFMLQQIIGLLRIHCIFGCGWKENIQSFGKHWSNCPNNPENKVDESKQNETNNINNENNTGNNNGNNNNSQRRTQNNNQSNTSNNNSQNDSKDDNKDEVKNEAKAIPEFADTNAKYWEDEDNSGDDPNYDFGDFDIHKPDPKMDALLKKIQDNDLDSDTDDGKSVDENDIKRDMDNIDELIRKKKEKKARQRQEALEQQKTLETQKANNNNNNTNNTNPVTNDNDDASDSSTDSTTDSDDNGSNGDPNVNNGAGGDSDDSDSSDMPALEDNKRKVIKPRKPPKNPFKKSQGKTIGNRFVHNFEMNTDNNSIITANGDYGFIFLNLRGYRKGIHTIKIEFLKDSMQQFGFGVSTKLEKYVHSGWYPSEQQEGIAYAYWINIYDDDCFLGFIRGSQQNKISLKNQFIHKKNREIVKNKIIKNGVVIFTIDCQNNKISCYMENDNDAKIHKNTYDIKPDQRYLPWIASFERNDSFKIIQCPLQT